MEEDASNEHSSASSNMTNQCLLLLRGIAELIMSSSSCLVSLCHMYLELKKLTMMTVTMKTTSEDIIEHGNH